MMAMHTSNASDLRTHAIQTPTPPTTHTKRPEHKAKTEDAITDLVQHDCDEHEELQAGLRRSHGRPERDAVGSRVHNEPNGRRNRPP